MSETPGRSARRRKQESYDIEIVNREIPALKDLHLETDLSGDVLVVPPDGDSGVEIGRRIAEALGNAAEVKSGSEVGGGDWNNAHIVAAETSSTTWRSGASA